MAVIYDDFDKVNDLKRLCQAIPYRIKIFDAKVNAGNSNLVSTIAKYDFKYSKEQTNQA